MRKVRRNSQSSRAAMTGSPADWFYRGAIWCCLSNIALAYPLCSTMVAPAPISTSLSFCSTPEYAMNGCCHARDDAHIKKTFDGMNITDANCAAVVKQILCAECDAFSATLFGHQVQEPRQVPYLCTSSSGSSSSYCSNVWRACLNATIRNSPFSPALILTGAPPPSTSLAVTTGGETQDGSLGSVFASEEAFCRALGPSKAVGEEFCFGGAPFVPPPAPSNYTLPEDICIEKVGKDSYLNLIPYPDGSNRVAVANKAGVVWLATLPGPGKPMEYNISAPFLDISARVTNLNELGFLGFAFHPNFKDNGRFFVSYNCDKQKWADCGAICACNKDTNCVPSDLRNGQLGGDGGTNPCRYSSVIAEYSVNSSSPNASPLEAEVADPNEKRRIFNMALPYTTHHAGGILFGPLDNYLYFMTGDGGNTGDPFNFAQNKKSLLGKILRIDVDNIPSPEDISNQNLWGEYTIPNDNPFVGQNGTRAEIWALGLRNPWRCTFDSHYPTYFYCGDVGQETVEEVDLISKGGNYGWRVYEGNLTYNPPLSPGGNTSANSIQSIFPILEYYHSSLNSDQGFAAITGGYVSYSREDPCLYGRYVYADLFGKMWVASELPRFSGNFRSADLTYTCSVNTPISCTYPSDNSSKPSFQSILSFGVDNVKNLYILASTGLYRVVHPSNCNRVCNEVLPALPPGSSPFPDGPPFIVPAAPPSPSNGTSSAHNHRSSHFHHLLVMILTFVSFISCSTL